MMQADTLATDVSITSLQPAGGSNCVYRPLIEIASQPALPFSESLFSCLLKQEKPCICNDLAIERAYVIKAKAPSVAGTTDEAAQPNVIAHVEAESTPIVPQSRSRRQGMMEAREAKGLEIAARLKITRQGNIWVVPSQTSAKKYSVNFFIQTCTCADYAENRAKCKHLYAVEFLLQRESDIQLPDPPKVVKRTYKQVWPAYHAAQVNEKAKFRLLLSELCKGIEGPMQEGAGRRRLPLSDIPKFRPK